MQTESTLTKLISLVWSVFKFALATTQIASNRRMMSYFPCCVAIESTFSNLRSD